MATRVPTVQAVVSTTLFVLLVIVRMFRIPLASVLVMSPNVLWALWPISVSGMLLKVRTW